MRELGPINCWPASGECLLEGPAEGRAGRQGLLLTAWGFFVFQVAEPEACDEMYESLARLHANYYKHKVSGQSLLSQPSDPEDQVKI